MESDGAECEEGEVETEEEVEGLRGRGRSDGEVTEDLTGSPATLLNRSKSKTN